MAEGRHAPDSPRRKTPLVIIGGVAVVAIVAASIFLFSGGSSGPLGDVVGGDTPDTPEFAFEPTKPIVITTAANPNPEAPEPTPAQIQTAKKKAMAAALPASEAATEALDAYYTAAFLDPANWQEASYDEVFTTFSARARSEAESQLEIMTAGSEAAFDYDTIEPLPSTLRTKVLLDPKGSPASVIGKATFQANGAGNGGRHVFKSKGQFVLQKVDGEWTIVGFSVSRADNDRPAATSTGPSGSDSRTSEPSGSTS